MGEQSLTRAWRDGRKWWMEKGRGEKFGLTIVWRIFLPVPIVQVWCHPEIDFTDELEVIGGVVEDSRMKQKPPAAACSRWTRQRKARESI